MYYLCSIGSNMEPHHHVSLAIDELVTQFGQLSLSSVIQTTPVGITSRHDFLNCLFVVESPLSNHELKGRFVAMEQAHGRDRSDPLCKVKDRPLDIDILASHPHGDFSAARVDSYLEALLAELCGEAVEPPGKISLSTLGMQIGMRPCQLAHPLH
ncbi:2-amino-4-hydroxy-6-hydroxymethyldihydropteridine diphosphokinase [Aeromonas diversa]|uniref:2-amino-4-hydroxy-6- hydroxymethyldihydropteridine diphosphokinase n=1 Tax=Aeromonas diversa TaxID=502790 RepID=UPI003462C132